MAAVPANLVYKGFWIDQRQDSIRGATLTTTSADAILIVAVLSVLVSFTGSHLWDLIAFGSYCIGVSKRPRRVWHHQRQLLARNITSPGAYSLETVKVNWAWRDHGGAWSSLTVTATLALACSIGFLVAGIFVSQVVSTSELQILVRSNSCGFLSWHNESGTLGPEYQQSVFREALAYAEACYNKSGSLSQCNLYAQQAVPIQRLTHTKCPFGDTCQKYPALTIDTGLLDSNDVFGINTNPGSRVQMQRVITCAPLNHSRYFTTRPMPSDYMKRFDAREVLPGEQLHEWSMGPLTMAIRPFNSSFWQSNYTSTLSTVFALTPRSFYVDIGVGTPEGWYSSTFVPQEEFRRDDADTHIIGIQYDGVRFFAPNEDPLFSAHRPRNVVFDNGTNITMYTGDNPATFLGCAEQMRFCFHNDTCTALLGAKSAYNEARKLAPSHLQNATLYYLFMQTPSMYTVTRAPMKVTRNAHSFQLGVPSDQWEIEFRSWFDFLQAVTQTTVPHLATGPGVVREDFDTMAAPLLEPDLCHSIRVGAPDGFSNINVLGLALIVAFSSIIILINLTLVPTLKFLHRKGVIFSPPIRSWIQDGVLQIQRQAHEANGIISGRKDEPIDASADAPPFTDFGIGGKSLTVPVSNVEIELSPCVSSSLSSEKKEDDTQNLRTFRTW